MSETTVQLIPCPFCEHTGDAVWIRQSSVVCQNCSAQGPRAKDPVIAWNLQAARARLDEVTRLGRAYRNAEIEYGCSLDSADEQQRGSILDTARIAFDAALSLGEPSGDPSGDNAAGS